MKIHFYATGKSQERTSPSFVSHVFLYVFIYKIVIECYDNV